LIELIRMLSELKDRPVCSIDLREYLAEQEHAEIGYIQSFGQILIKAAVVRPGNVLKLYPIGIHCNRTYYCADDNPRWKAAFIRFGAIERAEYLHKRGFLDCLSPGSPQSALERAAASSLRNIIEDAAGYLVPSVLRFRLDVWLEQHPCGSPATPPFCRLSRGQALELLKQETAVRAEYVPRMNYNRHLARICPIILRYGHSPAYCVESLRSYCAVQWPLGNEDSDREAVSLLQWILVMISVARSSPPA
jgi:hypothetical protein